jgi:hypothetical protein
MSNSTTSEGILAVNTNPMVFEELATSMATLASYARGDLKEPLEDMEHLYERALSEPPGYDEITELTGNSLEANDKQRGRAAWLLMNTEDLHVYGVHSRVWHNVANKYHAPIIKQMSLALNKPSRLNDGDMQQLGSKLDLIDVIGLHDDVIWLVQVVTEGKVADSVLGRVGGDTDVLSRSQVFNKPVLKGQALASLGVANRQMRLAFPEVDVLTFVLVMHPSGPDFELYQVMLPAVMPTEIILDEGSIKRNSMDFADKINADHDAMFTLPHQLEDKLFRGVPPCRGGRTLGMLALAASRQLESDELLQWRQVDFIRMLRDDFDYEVERDKVRHDLDDRLVAQGFFRKCGSYYYVSMKGIARYLYCLTKFTTLGNPKFELDPLVSQRDRILKTFGCIH